MDVNEFLEYLKTEKGASENTVTAYGRDVRAFARFLRDSGTTLTEATKTDVLSYLMELGKNGRSRATNNRKLASLRAYYEFLMRRGLVEADPTTDIRTPRAERKELEYLSVAEVEKLLAQPDDSIKGKRDRAILEVLYGTGIRVLELIDLNYADLNLRMGYLTCSGSHGRMRIVPLGSYARTAVEAYMKESRPALLRSETRELAADVPLFINYSGERFTRQGLWKVLREYGRQAGLEGRITPHILRTSFAVHMIQNGADLKTLQDLLGYDDMQALQAFLQVSKSRIKDVYDRTHPRA
ncbi:MAG: tyrosine recombinase [Firmicutes bacterium]|nr:tyrosine recombinase [Bacillota bacterium]